MRIYRCYLPFENVKAAKRALLEGVVKQPLTINKVPCHGVCLSTNIHDAIGRAQLASSGDVTILVCDVCVANPYPHTQPPKQPQDVVPAGYDCAVRLVEPQPSRAAQASTEPVVELVVQRAVMILSRAQVTLVNGSLV